MANQIASQPRIGGGLCDINTVAETLNVSRCTVRRWIAQGRLPAQRFGPRLIRIRVKDVEAFAKGDRVTA